MKIEDYQPTIRVLPTRQGWPCSYGHHDVLDIYDILSIQDGEYSIGVNIPRFERREYKKRRVGWNYRFDTNGNTGIYCSLNGGPLMLSSLTGEEYLVDILFGMVQVTEVDMQRTPGNKYISDELVKAFKIISKHSGITRVYSSLDASSAI